MADFEALRWSGWKMPVHWMDLGSADRFVLRGPEGALENEYSQMYITYTISYIIYFKIFIYIYSIFEILNIYYLSNNIYNLDNLSYIMFLFYMTNYI